MEVDASRSPDLAAMQTLAAAVMRTTDARVERLDGYLQRTFRLSNGTGNSFCLMKMTPPKGTRLLSNEEDRLGVEAAVLSHLGRQVDIAAPKLLEYQSSVSAVGDSYIISGPYSGSIMSFITRSWSESDRISVDYSLGVYFKRLASRTNVSFGSFRQPSSSSWAKCFATMLDAILKTAAEEGVGVNFDKVRDVVVKHAASLDQIVEGRLVLLEVKSGRNLVVDEHSKDVTSLIDYSTAIWGDPYLSDAFQRPVRGFLDGFDHFEDGDIDRRIRGLL